MKVEDGIQMDALVATLSAAHDRYKNLGLMNTLYLGWEQKVKLDQDYERARVEYAIAQQALAEFQRNVVKNACV